jgi:hypothetical protein
MSKVPLLPADEDCEISGLPMAFCSHCLGDKLGDEEEFGDTEHDYELVGRKFDAQYSGHCTIDYEHVVRRGTTVSGVQRADNPMLPVSGVACSACVKSLPHA